MYHNHLRVFDYLSDEAEKRFKKFSDSWKDTFAFLEDAKKHVEEIAQNPEEYCNSLSPAKKKKLSLAVDVTLSKKKRVKNAPANIRKSTVRDKQRSSTSRESIRSAAPRHSTRKIKGKAEKDKSELLGNASVVLQEETTHKQSSSKSIDKSGSQNVVASADAKPSSRTSRTSISNNFEKVSPHKSDSKDVFLEDTSIHKGSPTPKKQQARLSSRQLFSSDVNLISELNKKQSKEALDLETQLKCSLVCLEELSKEDLANYNISFEDTNKNKSSKSLVIARKLSADIIKSYVSPERSSSNTSSNSKTDASKFSRTPISCTPKDARSHLKPSPIFSKGKQFAVKQVFSPYLKTSIADKAKAFESMGSGAQVTPKSKNNVLQPVVRLERIESLEIEKSLCNTDGLVDEIVPPEKLKTDRESKRQSVLKDLSNDSSHLIHAKASRMSIIQRRSSIMRFRLQAAEEKLCRKSMQNEEDKENKAVEEKMETKELKENKRNEGQESLSSAVGESDGASENETGTDSSDGDYDETSDEETCTPKQKRSTQDSGYGLSRQTKLSKKRLFKKSSSTILSSKPKIVRPLRGGRKVQKLSTGPKLSTGQVHYKGPKLSAGYKLTSTHKLSTGPSNKSLKPQCYTPKNLMSNVSSFLKHIPTSGSKKTSPQVDPVTRELMLKEKEKKENEVLKKRDAIMNQRIEQLRKVREERMQKVMQTRQKYQEEMEKKRRMEMNKDKQLSAKKEKERKELQKAVIQSKQSLRKKKEQEIEERRKQEEERKKTKQIQQQQELDRKQEVEAVRLVFSQHNTSLHQKALLNNSLQQQAMYNSMTSNVKSYANTDTSEKSALNCTVTLDTTVANATFTLTPSADKTQLNSTFVKESIHPENPESYQITPPRSEMKPKALQNPDNYDIHDLKSDEETDDESAPRKVVPTWAKGANLRAALCKQSVINPIEAGIFSETIPHLRLETVFSHLKKSFRKRTSSAIWTSPLMPRLSRSNSK